MSSILCHALIQKKLHLPREMHGEILDFLLPKHLQKDNEYIKKYNKVLKELPKFQLSHVVDSDDAREEHDRNPNTYFSPFIIIQSKIGEERIFSECVDYRPSENSLLDKKNVKFIYQVNRDTFSYYVNITTHLTSSSVKLTLKNIDYELERENERILDYRMNKYDNGIEKKSRFSLVKDYDNYCKNQLHNNRDRAREIEKKIYKRLLCIK